MGYLFLCYKKLKLKIEQNPTTFERNALTVFFCFSYYAIFSIYSNCYFSALQPLQS